MRYEFYLDNVATGGFQLLNDAGGVAVVPNTGVYDDGTNYRYVQIYNATPTLQALYPTLLGPDATVLRIPWIEVLFLGTGTDTIRLFFQRARVQLRWTDGTNNTAIPGRWVGGGQDWSGFIPTDVSKGSVQMTWANTIQNHPESVFTTDLLNTSAYTLTDSSGIATWLALVGIAYQESGFAWGFISPATLPDPGGTGSAWNLGLQTFSATNYAFILRRQETDDIGSDPTYFIRQSDMGLKITYPSAWNESTGMLTIPTQSSPYIPSPTGDVPTGYTPPTLTGYKQFADIRVTKTDGTPVVGATVTFGAGLYTGTTTDQIVDGKHYGRVVIPCRPKGTFVDPSLAASGAVTTLKVSDVSPLPSSSSPNPAQIVPQHQFLPRHIDTLNFTSVNTTSMLGVSGYDPANTGSHLDYADLYGGEVVTVPYTDVSIVLGGTTYLTGGVLYIHEDSWGTLLRVNDGTGDDTVSLDALDVATDPFREPHWIENRDPEVWSWTGRDMEKDYSQRRALTDHLDSPSAVILRDHRRVMLGIVSGDARAWVSDNGWDTDATGTSTRIDNSQTYSKGILREGPDESLHVWLSTSAGAVYHSVSLDGGATWSAASLVSSLPTQRDERGDVRHNGECYLRAHPTGSGVTLYASWDGDSWTSEGTIVSTGTHPWLVVLPDRRLACVYHDGTQLAIRHATDASGSWVWSSAVGVVTVAATGAVMYANPQKQLLTYRAGKGVLVSYRSFDGGATWTTGSEG